MPLRKSSGIDMELKIPVWEPRTSCLLAENTTYDAMKNRGKMLDIYSEMVIKKKS